MVDSRIAEIAEYRFVVGMLHGKLVLRAVPELRLARWQPAQVSLPTKVAAAALAMFLFDPFKSRYPRPIATRITAASAAAVQILCFHSRLKLDQDLAEPRLHRTGGAFSRSAFLGRFRPIGRHWSSSLQQHLRTVLIRRAVLPPTITGNLRRS